MPSELLTVLIIIFLATCVRAVFGFADALVAMPLLTVILGLRSATPLVALMSLTNAAVILLVERHSLNFKSASLLILFTLPGIPVGLFLLKGVHEPLMKGILAALLILFSLFKLYSPRSLSLQTDRLAPFFGLASGVLGGAYNTNGPPVVMYAALRNWAPGSFRATLQAYFFLTGFFIVLGHGLSGLWTELVIGLYLRALPFMAAALLAGGLLSRRLPAQRFARLVYVLLLVLGLYLLLQTFIGF